MLPWPVVFYEAPHRIAETLADLAERFGAARELVICRELTKKFEEVARLPLGEAAGWLAARAERSQGEFVLVLEPARSSRSRAAVDADAVLELLLEALRAERGGAARGAHHRRAEEPAVSQGAGASQVKSG